MHYSLLAAAVAQQEHVVLIVSVEMVEDRMEEMVYRNAELVLLSIQYLEDWGERSQAEDSEGTLLVVVKLVFLEVPFRGVLEVLHIQISLLDWAEAEAEAEDISEAVEVVGILRLSAMLLIIPVMVVVAEDRAIIH
jgi:hypothetical protein